MFSDCFHPLQKESRRFWILFLDAFVLVCCIELFQLFTAFGAFDVDDILLNCAGALLGYAVFARCLRDARRNAELALDFSVEKE